MAKSATKFSVAPAPLPVLPAPALPAKGAVTLARWGACLKGKAGVVVLTGPKVKAMSLDTVITNNVAQNPKRNAVNPFVPYGFNNVVGASCTLGQYIAAIEKANMGGATQACAHVAWDANHNFISLSAASVANAAALEHLA